MNGRDALDRIARADARLILLDLMMPEMDGFEFIGALRASNAWQSIPVVVVTAKDIDENERARLNGSVGQDSPQGRLQPRRAAAGSPATA